ncbi:Vacuolar protein sorting-associated protein 51 [Entomortierella beljakovae]|nr:Vacuolar protein sorting-associated protein 51 [Entomortierella beljakovae]
MPTGPGDVHPKDASSTLNARGMTLTAPTVGGPESSRTTTAPGSGVKSGAGATTTRRRAKSFLRNYYGIQQAENTNQSGPKDGTNVTTGHVSKSDPYDLDNHSFEVDKYMHKMFVEKQLPGLVQADNELVADIRQLDGDMKTLVYENYSKFLSATDTINKMKSNVDNLESEMSRLTENIGKIAVSSSAIHSSLGGKRDKIRQLNGVHSLLTKLQFVFELPTNLHQCLESESYTQAVRSYCRTLHLLQHYKHMTVFTGIERECKTIMIQIAQRIKQKMCAEQATIPEISECVGLLIALQEDPIALWKQYLDLSMNYLQRLYVKTLKDIEQLPLYTVPSPASPKSAQTPTQATPKKTPKKSKTPTSGKGTTSANSTPKETKTKSNISMQSAASPISPPTDKVSYLNAYFLKQVEGFVISFINYYLTPSSGVPSSGSNGGSALSDDSTALDRQSPSWISKDSRVCANLTCEQQEEASRAVKEAVLTIIKTFLDAVTSFLDYPEDIFSVKPEVHIHILQNLYLGTSVSSGLCQLIGFDVLVTGLIQNWETQLIRQALGSAKKGLLEKIATKDVELVKKKDDTGDNLDATIGEANTTSNSGPASTLKEITIWLKDAFKADTIPFLEKCMSSDAHFLETKDGRALFLQNLQDNFKDFWGETLKEMLQQSGTASVTRKGTKSGSISRTFSLIMSQLCFELSNTVVEQLYRTLSKTLFRPGKRTRSGSFLIESYEEPSVIPQLQGDCKFIIQSCQETGHLLLDNFIARTGNELSLIVMDAQSVVNYITIESPPTKVSDTWERVYKDLNEIEHQVIAIYGDEGDRLGNHEISSESLRRESIFNPAGGSNNGNSSRLSNRNESLASFGSTTINSRFENQQRNLLLSNIDKLFSDRVEIFIRCQDLNRTGIMFGIIKILLKAWVESVRMKTFGKGGFQQVQTDAEFAKIWLWRFATADERLMHSLLEETQQIAYRRCIDAVPLDMNVSFLSS